MRIDEFLLARIAEDEAMARAATPGPWYWEPKSDEDWPCGDESLRSSGVQEDVGHGRRFDAVVITSWGYDAYGTEARDEDRAYIAAWSPVRVLRECEAKRRIIELHPPEPRYVEVQSMCEAEPREVYAGTYIPTEMRIIAAVYADHPDCDPAWQL